MPCDGNNAISDMLEPGSTFKTASIMVALEDGKITPDYIVDTGNGQKPMHGRHRRRTRVGPRRCDPSHGRDLPRRGAPD